MFKMNTLHCWTHFKPCDKKHKTASETWHHRRAAGVFQAWVTHTGGIYTLVTLQSVVVFSYCCFYACHELTVPPHYTVTNRSALSLVRQDVLYTHRVLHTSVVLFCTIYLVHFASVLLLVLWCSRSFDMIVHPPSFPYSSEEERKKLIFVFQVRWWVRETFLFHIYNMLCLPSAEPEVVLQLCNIYWPKVGFSFLFLFFFQGLKRVLTVNRLTRKVVNCSLASHGVLCSLCAPGFGWGMVFTPMVATVMANFTRRRALALGLGFSSIGLSSFAFNPLFQLLVETYAWRGALLILGALSLNIVPCGALIRPQRRSKAPAKVEQKEEQGSGLV